MRFVRWITLVLISGQLVRCNKPVLDLSNNMRLVLIPADTKLGTPFYKLRASDADDDYPLEFRAFGEFARKFRSRILLRSLFSLSFSQSSFADRFCLPAPLFSLSVFSGADSEMIRIENVDCSRSICEADVVLVKTLSKAKGVYRLNLEVESTDRLVMTSYTMLGYIVYKFTYNLSPLPQPSGQGHEGRKDCGGD